MLTASAAVDIGCVAMGLNVTALHVLLGARAGLFIEARSHGVKVDGSEQIQLTRIRLLAAIP